MTLKLTGSRSSVQSLITGGCVVSRARWCCLFFNLRMIYQVGRYASHNTQSLYYELQWQHWVWARTWGDRGGQLPQVKTGCPLGGSPGRAIFYVMWLTCMQNMEIITTAEVLHIPAAETGSSALLDIFRQKLHHWSIIIKMDTGTNKIIIILIMSI